jgi:hypothetical protein
MQSVKENRARPLFRVSGELCSEKAQNELDRVSIVRDVRLRDASKTQSRLTRSWTIPSPELVGKVATELRLANSAEALPTLDRRAIVS